MDDFWIRFLISLASVTFTYCIGYYMGIRKNRDNKD